VRNRIAIVAVLGLFAAERASAQQPPDFAAYLISDRVAEIAFARTAAPKNVSDSATVLVLERHGFVEAAHGTNGFTCFVDRSFDSRVGDPNFWNPNTRAPHCINAPATRTVLRDIKKRAEWVLAGVKPEELAARSKRAYASHELLRPEAGAMAYMLSPTQHLNDGEQPHWMPHLMLYVDAVTPASVYGADGDPSIVIDGSADDHDRAFRVLLIPVRRWSDGTLAMPATGH
jgi:hypothetical protein